MKRIECAPGIQIHEMPISFYPTIEDEDEPNPDLPQEISLKQYEGPGGRMEDPEG